MESGLKLRLHANLPIHFWVEAFSIAMYLINILPTSVLQWDTPYHKLFGTILTIPALRFLVAGAFRILGIIALINKTTL